MIVKYVMGEDDLLLHELYTFSSDEKVKIRRSRGRDNWCVIFVGLGMISLTGNLVKFAIFWFALAIAWFLLYHKWRARRYKKHFQEAVHSKMKKIIGRTYTYIFDDGLIVATDGICESKIPLSELEEIREIQDMFFLLLNGTQSLIIPKNDAADTESTGKYLQELASKLGIPYTKDDNWKWK